MKKVVKGFASIIMFASMIFVVGCKPPTNTSEPSTGGSSKPTGQSKITVTVKGDERIDLSMQIEEPYDTAWSDIKAVIQEKIKPTAAWKADWDNKDYGFYEWRLGDENGEKIRDDYHFTDNTTVYAVSNYIKWKIVNNKLVGYRGSKPRGKIIIPEGVTSIGDFAFYECTSLGSIAIPESVTSIEDWAFNGCSSLESITIPARIISIGVSAFAGCTGLTSIKLPKDLTSIGNWAFNGCTSLGSITIPASVTWIGVSAFLRCENLKTLTVDSGNTNYKSDNNIIYTIDGTGLIAAANGLSGAIDIPDGVTSIGNWAFAGCSSLSSITIPANVTWIGIRAFAGCSSFSSITIPNSVESIGKGAFGGCSSLHSVDFADPKGWAVYKDNNCTDKAADIDEPQLKDKSTAASLLRETYREEYWKKN